MILKGVFMSNLEKVFNGFNLYPMNGEKYISIVLKGNMRESYKDIFELDCSFEEFIDLLKDDNLSQKISLDILFEYFGFKKMPVITDSSYENWYFIKYNDCVTNPYTFSYVDKIGSMNTLSMMDDYIDLFNNKIVYKSL